MKSLLQHSLIILVLTALAFWLRFANLGVINLYNDEFYQFEAAVGWLKTGQFAEYDFVRQVTVEPYTRARLYTLQIATSLDWFGISEASARLPAVFWGTILIPVTILCLWVVTRNYWLAYGTGTIVTFSDFFVQMSRFTRMYSMVFTLTVIVVCGLYYAVSTQHWHRRYAAVLLVVVAWLLDAAVFTEFALALGAAFGVYVLWRALWYWHDHSQIEVRWVYTALAGIGSGLIMIIIHYAGWHIIPISAFIVRSVPHWEYWQNLFLPFRWPIIAMVAAMIGVAVGLAKPRTFYGCMTIIASALLVYFIFFSHRWSTHRYIGFFELFWYALTILGGYSVYSWFKPLLKQSARWARWAVAAILIALLTPWLSWPGVSANVVWVQQAFADATYLDLKLADVRDSYQFVANQYQPCEVVLLHGLRTYYWPDRSIPVFELGNDQVLTFDQFLTEAKRGRCGGWLVYSVNRQRHLRPAIKQFTQDHFTHYREFDRQLVRVYHFLPADLL